MKNDLTGSIPSDVELTESPLRLSNNSLTGEIPKELANEYFSDLFGNMKNALCEIGIDSPPVDNKTNRNEIMELVVSNAMNIDNKFLTYMAYLQLGRPYLKNMGDIEIPPLV